MVLEYDDEKERASSGCCAIAPLDDEFLVGVSPLTYGRARINKWRPGTGVYEDSW